MRICILCEDKNIEAARLNCKNLFSAEPKDIEVGQFKVSLKTHLSTPLSETGELPVTHWFCFMSCNDESFKRVKENALYSTIEESSPKEFLEKWNLKIIK